jgi:hypothetical protein
MSKFHFATKSSTITDLEILLSSRGIHDKEDDKLLTQLDIRLLMPFDLLFSGAMLVIRKFMRNHQEAAGTSWHRGV